MACPHVAGVLALGYSVFPAASKDEILSCMRSTADDATFQHPEIEVKSAGYYLNYDAYDGPYYQYVREYNGYPLFDSSYTMLGAGRINAGNFVKCVLALPSRANVEQLPTATPAPTEYRTSRQREGARADALGRFHPRVPNPPNMPGAFSLALIPS
jgi:hypothetical protein